MNDMEGTPYGDFLYHRLLNRINDILLELKDELNKTGLIVESPIDQMHNDINNFLNTEDNN